MNNTLLGEKQLDTKQLYTLIFIIMMSMKMFMVPALLIHEAGRDSYITMAFFVGVEIVSLLVCLIAIKIADADIYTVFEGTYGKIVTTVLLLVLSAYYILKVTLIISEVKMFFLFSASEEFSWEIYIIPLLVFLLAVSIKTLNGIGRLAQLLLPVIALSIVMLFVLIIDRVDYSNLLPIMANGSEGVLSGIKKYPVWFGDLPIFAFCIGQVKKKKGFVWRSMLTVTISAAVVMFFSTVLFLTYAYLYPMVDYGHNISNMVVYAAGNYMYGRFDLLIFCVWLTSVLIQMGFITYVTVRHISHVFRAKSNFWTGLGVIIALYLISNNIFKSEIKLYNFCMGIPRYFTILSTVALPILALIAAIVYTLKKGKKEEKGENDDAHAQNSAV